MTIGEIYQSGELSGYQPGQPEGPMSDVDQEICQDATCENCGHQGCEFYPYSKPGSYRAFAVCPDCGEAMEF